MAFMYLHLRNDDNGHVTAEVLNEGAVRSLGTGNSRWSTQPFAVIAIDGFAGIECISDDDLWAELERRDEARGRLAARFLRAAKTADLLAELGKRTRQ